MIGDEEVRPPGIEGVEAAPSEPGSGAADEVSEPVSKFAVQVLHRTEVANPPGEGAGQRPAGDARDAPEAPRQQEARHAPRRGGVRRHPTQHARDLVVAVGPDVVELFHGRVT